MIKRAPQGPRINRRSTNRKPVAESETACPSRVKHGDDVERERASEGPERRRRRGVERAEGVWISEARRRVEEEEAEMG